MKAYYVYKEDYCQYSESGGVVVISSSWQRAKGIGMEKMRCEPHERKNIKVEEITFKEGVVCYTNYIFK